MLKTFDEFAQLAREHFENRDNLALIICSYLRTQTTDPDGAVWKANVVLFLSDLVREKREPMEVFLDYARDIFDGEPPMALAS